MSGSHLCIPRNETVQPSALENRIIMFCLPIPTQYNCDRFIYFQDRSDYFAAAKYGDRSWEYTNCSQKHECGNWDRGRAIPGKGIHKWDFHCSAVYYDVFVLYLI